MQPNNQTAIQLIRVNEDGRYIITQEGAKFISNIPSPIAVVSVAGMYRTGKSYLLNRMLLNRCNGFGVGPTVNPCTKGLWCWSKTIPGKTVQGESVNVIIIDTEGIGALDEDQTHDTRIFTLAILSASSFIYNSTGSIDENALQNLSLVVNLTRSIQLNSLEGQEEEDDPEEMAKYFPSFYWVVRDFSLQLTTSDGEPISPKEYLERALAPQKGFSDDIEEKNRIRRLLSTFFKERQCFTMVRPLVDETKLQHLDKLELDELRPQFVEQAMNFRRRVLNKVKPKLLHGKQLDGQMYLCLLNSYITSINNGAVPNIQNAWNYMCQQQCAKAFEESLETFNSEFGSNIKSHLPIQEQYLIDYLSELKDKCCEEFEKKAIGEQIKFHLKELGSKLQQKIQTIKLDNEKQSESILRNYFKKNIVQIQNKLKVRQYQKFEEFTKDLNEFYARILEAGPNLPRKELIYLQLIKRVVPMAADIFLKQKTQQYDQLKSLSTEKEENLMKIQETLKSELQQETDKNKERVSVLDRQIIELKLCVDDLKGMNEEMTSQLQNKQKNEGKLLKQHEEKITKLNEKYTKKVTQLNETIEKLENQSSMAKYEEEKQMALLSMKITQLEQNLSESRKREESLDWNLKSQQKKFSELRKELTEKFQSEIKNKQITINSLNITLAELEQAKSVLQAQLDEKLLANEQTVSSLKLQFSERQSNLNKKVSELEKTLASLQTSQSQLIVDSEKHLEASKQKCNTLEKQLQQLNDQHKTKTNTFNKDIAVLKQKIEFLQTENKDYEDQLAKTKQMYQNIIDEDRNRREEEEKLMEAATINEITEKYDTTIQEIKNEHEIILKRLSVQLEQITSKYNEQTLKIKLLESNNEALLEQKMQSNDEYELKYQSMVEKSEKQLEEAKSQLLGKYKQSEEKVRKLTEYIEEMDEQKHRQREEMVNKAQLGLKQVKNYYELEKQRAENKLVNEKQKYERKLRMMKEEYEDKMKEQVSQIQQQNDRLRSEIMELEQQFNKELNNRKIQLDIKTKNMETLEKNYEEARNKLEHKQADWLARIEKEQKQSKQQKESMETRIDELLTIKSKLQLERNNLKNNKDSLQKVIDQKDQELIQIKQEFNELKQKVQKEKEDFKVLKNQMNSKRNQQRVEFQKKVALLEQENTYIRKKLEENQKMYGAEQETNEEKIKRIREEYAQEIKAEKEKTTTELESLEKKYDGFKKQTKQKEALANKTILELQKQLAITTQRLSNATEKLTKSEDKLGQQLEQYGSQMANMKSAYYKEKQQLKELLEKQQQEKQKFESEKKSIEALYQQEKLLWENRIKFLEENKEKVKTEYETSKTQLEAIIDKNRKKYTTQKHSIESAHSQKIAKIEKKHWAEKQQIMDSFKKQEADSEAKVKTLQFELRTLKEKSALNEQTKLGEMNMSEKKLKQLVENQKRLQIEVEKLRGLRQKENKEQHETFQKQKNDLRQKNMEKDEKLKASEKQRQHLFYEIEKQKAKWGIQKDTIMNKIQQQKQVIAKNERDIQKLQRQNEKLKVEKKCHKTSLNSVSRYGNSFGFGEKAGSSRSSFEDSIILKENNNSQISDTSLFFKE